MLCSSVRVLVISCNAASSSAIRASYCVNLWLTLDTYCLISTISGSLGM
jgi:hypothetical protein